MHGASWACHHDAKLSAQISDDSLVSKYRFGTATADFYACARCGGVPFVTSAIDGRLYAVVNVNTFESIKPASLPRTAADFDGEDTRDRLGRRQRNWIASVAIAGGP
jgi:hypothetical protein